VITLILVALAFYFGFEIGRRWEAGVAEEELEAYQSTQATGRIRLSSMRIRH
jgi:hypothetical protein